MMSSGNAASSVALYAALSGVRAVVLMYRGGTREKTFVTQAYGAAVIPVDAEREADVLCLAERISSEMGWSLMNTVVDGNPLISEGYKTPAYELALELGDEDAVMVPVGSGTLLSGIWKGFREMVALGALSRMPKLVGVQPEGSCPIVNAYSAGLCEAPRLDSAPRTVATALTLDDPRESGALALRGVRESGGLMLAVEDKALLAACWQLAREGIALVEPAAAAGAAALDQAHETGVLPDAERVVCVLTGHGLKDISPVERLLRPVLTAGVDLAELNRAYAMGIESERDDGGTTYNSSRAGGDNN